MSLTKDGFYKSFSGAIGNDNYLLEAGGGHIGWGNAANQIPYSNGTVNTSLNADMTDGLHVHTGRNNEANKIVRTDGNGYIQAGWINTTSGDMGSKAFSRIYVSNDAYIRYVSVAKFKTGLFGGQVGSPSVPIYWTGSAFATCIVSFGNQSYGEHNANNINDNGIKYYNSNGPSTSLGATTSDGALYSQAYSTSWVAQIAQDYRNGGLYVRGKNNGTWQSWYRVWDNRTTYVSGGKGYIGSTEITQVNNADTVDGYHQDHLLPYRYTYGAQTNSGSANWYVRIQTASYISEDCTIYVRGTGNNTSSDLVIHVLCRENRFWGWETSYNGVRINGIAKETGAPEIIYLRMPSSTTSITFKSTHSLTIDKADYSSKSYMSLGEGLFANYIYGRIQNADYADTLSNPGKYYWANIPMQTSSDSTKQPTFGRTNITYAATNGTSALQVNIGSTNYAYGVDIQSSIAVGNTAVSLLAGVNHSKNNQLSGLFYYAGNNSTSNRFGFGFYGNDNILNIRADKRVGICTTAPAYTLDVTGTIRATSRIYANEWIEFSQAYTGLYWPNGNNASHFHPNDATTYGNFVLRGSRGGYTGIQFGRSTNYMTIMDNATDKGLYQEGQRWILYYSRSTGNVSVRSSGALGYNINLYGSVGTDSHMYSYGFHHLSHNNDDAVLLAGGGWEYKSYFYRNLGGGNYITITVGGDANTYYPVVIGSPSDYYPYQFVNITRTYSETAPNTWNTSTHKGGLSMAIFWNGSRYWDGNASGSEAFVVRLYQSYCTMVGGVDNSTAGKVVWLRGGGANYHIFSMNGRSQSATVYLSTYTDSASRSFAPRTTPVTPTVQWPGDIQNGAGYLRDRSNGTATYVNYGAAGLGLGSITWLTCWNGYELRAISKGELGGLTNVYQHTTNNVDYPLIWSNQNNTSNVQANQLHKSYADLVYNPANKRISTQRFQSSLTTSSHIAGLNGTGVPFNSTASAGYNMVLRVLGTGGAYNLGVYNNSFVVVYGAQSLINAGTNSYTHAIQLMNLNGLTMLKNLKIDGNNHINEATSASYRLHVVGSQKIESGSLQVYPTGGNYNDGIRIHVRSSDKAWAAITFCGSDNTGDTGISANSWFLGNNNGNFYLNKNNSNGANANRLWGHANGYTVGSTSRASANLTVTSWIEVTGGASATMSYATTNPRITFSENGSQAVGIVYTDYDSYRASKGLKVMDVDNTDTGNVWLEVQRCIYGNGIFASLNGSSTDNGLSLYGSDYTYALMFRGTGNRGKWGDVQSDWATYSTMSNTAQRGWVWQSGTGEANMSAALSVRGVFATRAVGNNAGYLAFPQNNSYYTSTSTVTGALKVVLPRYQTNTMIMFDVNIFTYDEGTSNIVTYRIGGYEYGSTGWYAPVSKVFSWGRGDKVNLNIRFGYDGSKTCVTIGETNTTWKYPQVSITNVTYGYSDVAISSWGYGWDISFTTTLPSSVSTTFTDPYFNGMYWANQRVRPTSSTNTTPQFGYVGIGTAPDSSYARLSFVENENAICFRKNTSYKTCIQYKTVGNEALVFATQQTVTSFIFKCGYTMSNGSDWQSGVIGTPSVQIKGQSLYVNTAIANGSNPGYNFYVSGNSLLAGTTYFGSTSYWINNGGVEYMYDIRASRLRLVDNWIGFYTSNNVGGNRLGYIQTDGSYMYFRKENGNSGFNFNGNLVPSSNNSYTIGTSSLRWANVFGVLGNYSGQVTVSVANGTAPFAITSTTKVNNLNVDLLDGWHQSNLVWSGYVTSGTASLSSYWFKAWTGTITSYQYNDLDFTLLISSAFNSKRGTIHIRIRQNGANNGGAYNFTKGLWLVNGNIPLADVRLYCNNSNGVCELWMNVVGQYGVYNYTVIKKTWRTGVDITSFGTLTASNFTTAQSVPALSDQCIQLSVSPLVGYYWANIQVQSSSSTTTTPQFGKIMVNTTSTTYTGNFGGDIYATGWSRAGSGFYCEGNGVHYTHAGAYGEIYTSSNNVFNFTTGSWTTLYFNYGSNKFGNTYVTNFIWNAGSSTSYANHTMGHLSVCATSENAYPNYAAIEVRERIRGGTGITHNYANAPRIGFHWGNRYWANLTYFDNVFRFMNDSCSGYITILSSGFRHSSVDSNNYVLLAGGGYKALSDFLLKPSYWANIQVSTSSNTWTEPTFGRIYMQPHQGSWVSGMTTNPSIWYNNSNAIDASSYWAFLGMKSSSSHVINFGGLGNDIGFYGYYSGRTANSYDWRFTVNMTNGVWTTTKDFYSDSHMYSYGFHHRSYNSATYLLRSDGGVSAFNWSGQGGQPTWLWGGNSQHTYYVYNPSNFSVNYANYAGYAHKLDIYGYNTDGLSFYQTSSSFQGSNSGWAHYIIANHGNGSTYYNYILRLPFWGPPQYARKVNGTNSSWYTFITTENGYWANQPIQTASSTATNPQFNSVNVGGTSTGYGAYLASGKRLYIEGTESNAIYTEHHSNGHISINSPVSNAAIRHGFIFKWYDTYWNIGNVRGGGTNSAGFGIAYSGGAQLQLLVKPGSKTWIYYGIHTFTASHMWTNNPELDDNGISIKSTNGGMSPYIHFIQYNISKAWRFSTYNEGSGYGYENNLILYQGYTSGSNNNTLAEYIFRGQSYGSQGKCYVASCEGNNYNIVCLGIVVIYRSSVSNTNWYYNDNSNLIGLVGLSIKYQPKDKLFEQNGHPAAQQQALIVEVIPKSSYIINNYTNKTTVNVCSAIGVVESTWWDDQKVIGRVEGSDRNTAYGAIEIAVLNNINIGGNNSPAAYGKYLSITARRPYGANNNGNIGLVQFDGLLESGNGSIASIRITIFGYMS